MPATPIRVLWLRDNRPGHLNKVKGFLALLARTVPLEITTCDLRWRFSPLRHLVGRLSGFFLNWWPALFLKNFHPGNDFDLIISSGGLTQWPNVLMARRTGAPNVYIGSPHHFPSHLFTLIPMTDPPHGNPPFLKLELVLSEVSPDAARESARQHFPHLAELGWTLLMGGDGEGMKWSDADFLRLADRFIDGAEKAGKPMFVVTSRRTPERVEKALIGKFEGRPGFVTGAWFHQSGEKTLPVLALLGASSKIIVTADSVSMTNEAVASGVPSIAIYPPEGKPKPRHEAQFSLLENDGKLARFKLATAGNLEGLEPAGGWRLITGDSHAAIAVMALERLGFNSKPADA